MRFATWGDHVVLHGNATSFSGGVCASGPNKFSFVGGFSDTTAFLMPDPGGGGWYYGNGTLFPRVQSPYMTPFVASMNNSGTAIGFGSWTAPDYIF